MCIADSPSDPIFICKELCIFTQELDIFKVLL